MTDEAEQATKSLSERAAREWVQNRFGHVAIKFHGDDSFEANPCVQAHLAGQSHERERLKQKALAYKSGIASKPDYVQGHWDGQKALFEHLFGEEQA